LTPKLLQVTEGVGYIVNAVTTPVVAVSEGDIIVVMGLAAVPESVEEDTVPKPEATYPEEETIDNTVAVGPRKLVVTVLIPPLVITTVVKVTV